MPTLSDIIAWVLENTVRHVWPAFLKPLPDRLPADALDAARRRLRELQDAIRAAEQALDGTATERRPARGRPGKAFVAAQKLRENIEYSLWAVAVSAEGLTQHVRLAVKGE